MLAALLCGLGLPSPRAREPLFASTSAVQRESRGKDGGAFAEIQVEWCYDNTDKNACDKSYFLNTDNVPTRCSWVKMERTYGCRPSLDKWVEWCYENDDRSTCDESYFVTQEQWRHEAGVPKRCAWDVSLGKCRPARELRIPLVAGWNRISWNVELDAPLLSQGQDAALLDAVVELRGVDGPVSEVIQSPLQGYKLQMASGPHELVLSGPPVNVCKVIRLKAGVTWIPYLLQDEEAPLSALRRTAGVWTQGDTIRDETSGTFTTHYDGFGWYGTLKTLRAGRMYVVTSAEKGILTYAGEGECV